MNRFIREVTFVAILIIWVAYGCVPTMEEEPGLQIRSTLSNQKTASPIISEKATSSSITTKALLTPRATPSPVPSLTLLLHGMV